jgi:hypothetical protein
MPVRVGQADRAEQRHRAWGERGSRPLHRLPEQGRAAGVRLQFQLELDVALIVQPDTKGVLRSLTTAPLS